MKQELTNYIIDHIFTNLGLTGHVRTSLNQNIFKIPQTIQYSNFNIKNDELKESEIYGAEITIDNNKIKLLATKFIFEGDSNIEWYLLIKVGDQPTHGCYLITDGDDSFNGVIVFYLNDRWVPTNTGTQASVLVGMELLADATAVWEKITNYTQLIKEIKSFVEYTESSLIEEE